MYYTTNGYFFAFCNSGWATDLEFDRMDVSHCISIGFIYRQTKDYVWIFSSLEIS